MDIDVKLIALCGFYCGSCPTYRDDNCQGCRGGSTGCFTFRCVSQKKITFCGQCLDFPCDEIINQKRATILDKDWLEWKKRSKRK